MREIDYINATNIAKVRTCMNILRDIHPEGRYVTEDESVHVHRCLLAWEQRLTRAVSAEAKQENKEPWLQKWPEKTT